MNEPTRPPVTEPTGHSGNQPAYTTGRRRVHPLTAVSGVLAGFVGLAAVALFNGPSIARGLRAATDGKSALLVVGLALAALLVVGAVIGAGAYVSWKYRFYELSADQLTVGAGWVVRQRRTARLDRVQAVDVNRPLLAQILGLAELKVETAGGSNSQLVIKYLTVAECADLRRRVLAGAAYHNEQARPGRSGPFASESAGAPAARSESAPVVGPAQGAVLLDGPLPASRLLGSVLLRTGTAVAAGAVVLVLIAGGAVAAAGVVTAAGSVTWIAGVIGAVSVGALVAIGAAVLGVVGGLWSSWNRFHGFTLTDDPQSGRLFIRAGLTTTRQQTVPIRRIHALQVTEPLWWRATGWARVNATIAGYAGEAGEVTTTVLPVAPCERADAVVDRLVGEMTGGVGGRTEAQWASPRRARWVSPIDWSQQRVTVTERALVVHHGRFSRRRAHVPWARIQGHTLLAGPVAQRLGVVDVRIDLVSGPVAVTVRQLDPADAAQLLTWLQIRRAA